MKRSFTVGLFMLAATGPSFADDASSKLAFFYDSCVSSGPDFERTSERAKAEEWPSMAQDLALTFTPMENPETLEGWIVNGGEAESFRALVISRAEVGGKIVEGCTVALGDVDAAVFETALVEKANAISAGQEQGQDRVYKRYTATINGRSEAITLTLPLYAKGSDQIIASAVAEQQIEH
ncbi:hypothetical protein PMI09_04296 [Rhizobium sp. CF122]|uniref:hypothetical protein n=1 Tax=Rhizobium sp. CF122 TaxID=1144312 RepID=UPI0002718F97|nr:hypothetical protein [Rhizobium sp. CF122]EJL51809.1 hypothetical protein PMI09_04296 [Rhizobium sp. CF122]